MDLVEENLKERPPEKQIKTDQEDDENATDDYEGWKSKILKAAANKEQSMVPVIIIVFTNNKTLLLV